MTTRMSCSISSTESSCSSRSRATKAVKSAVSCGFMPAVGSSSSSSFGSRRERARDLEPALVAVRQVLADHGIRPRKPGVHEQLSRAHTRVGLLALDTGRAQDRFDQVALQPHVHADEHVLERRHVLEEADVLERSPDAAVREGMWRLTGHVFVREDHAPRRRPVDAREHVEERRLAGAVRTDQADDRAARDGEIDVVDRDEAAELLTERLRLQQDVRHRPSPRRRAARRAGLRASPPPPVSSVSAPPAGRASRSR